MLRYLSKWPALLLLEEKAFDFTMACPAGLQSERSI